MISFFRDEAHFLSNFAFINVELRGKTWRTAEHIFQACKTMHQNEIEMIRLAESPGRAKQIGRKVTLRDNWNDLRIDFMRKTLIIKFKHITKFGEELMRTNIHELVEGNYHHDNFWGSCQCAKCHKSKGKNNLGKLLMDIRQELLTA